MKKACLLSLLSVMAFLFTSPRGAIAMALNDLSRSEILLVNLDLQPAVSSKILDIHGSDFNCAPVPVPEINRSTGHPPSAVADDYRIFTAKRTQDDGPAADEWESPDHRLVSLGSSAGDNSGIIEQPANSPTGNNGPSNSKTLSEPFTILLLGLSMVGLASIGRKRLTR